MSVTLTTGSTPILKPARASNFRMSFGEGDPRIGASVVRCTLPSIKGMTTTLLETLGSYSPSDRNTFMFDIELDETNIIAPWLTNHVTEKQSIVIELLDAQGTAHLRYDIRGASFDQIMLSELAWISNESIMASVRVVYDCFVFGGAST